MQVELGVDLALRRQRAVELVQEPTLELPRLDLELGSRGPVDDADRYARVTDPVAQLRGEVPLDLLAAEVLDARQDAADQHLGSRLGKERRTRGDAIARVALAKVHLPGASVVARRSQQKIFAQRPEAQQADAELALQSLRSLRLEPPLDRIADVGGDVVEVRLAVGVPAHALAVVLHAQVMLSLVLAAGDDDRLRARVDAVLDQLRDRLERIALRQRDDRDRVPVIADAEVAARRRLGGLFGATGGHEVPTDHIRLAACSERGGNATPANPMAGSWIASGSRILPTFAKNHNINGMSTMNISLPVPLKSFVDEQVKQRGYGTSSEYVRDLIRKDQERTRLRDLLLEGAASASAGPADRAYFDRLRKRARRRTSR